MIQLCWAKPKAKAKAKPKAKPRAKAKPKAKPKAKAKTKGKGNAKGEATGKGNGKGNGVLSANCFSAIVYSFVPLHWRPGKASLEISQTGKGEPPFIIQPTAALHSTTSSSTHS